jgi:hypothetical protein
MEYLSTQHELNWLRRYFLSTEIFVGTMHFRRSKNGNSRVWVKIRAFPKQQEWWWLSHYLAYKDVALHRIT